MKKAATSLKLPKERNFFAAAVNDPCGPFRPKTIPNKKDKDGVIPRKRKHKGNDNAL
jgi:hypothetical protein